MKEAIKVLTKEGELYGYLMELPDGKWLAFNPHCALYNIFDTCEAAMISNLLM